MRGSLQGPPRVAFQGPNPPAVSLLPQVTRDDPSLSLGPSKSWAVANCHHRAQVARSTAMLQTQVGLGSQAAPRFAEHGTAAADAGRPGPPTLSVASHQQFKAINACWQGRPCRLKPPQQRYDAPSSPIFSSRFSPDWYCSRCDSKSCTDPTERLGPLLPWIATTACNIKPHAAGLPVRACVRVCARARVRVCVCARACLRASARECVSLPLHGCVRERVYVFVCLYMRACACDCVRV